MEHSSSSETADVSVVVAVYNESRHIVGCLRSLVAQRPPAREIIVVDDGSTDGTAKLAASVPGVRVLRQRHAGPAVARNRGAGEAGGAILVFVDGDMEFPPEFLGRLVRPILDGRAIGTFTREIEVANGHRRWARAHMLGRYQLPDRHFPPDFPDEWVNYRAVLRDRFAAVGGYDEVGHGEDITLGRKLGVPAVVAPGAVCRHHEPDSVVEIFRSARWYGRGDRVQEQADLRRHYGLRASVRRGLVLAVRHRMPTLLLYRLLWDHGVRVGLRSRSRPGAAP